MNNTVINNFFNEKEIKDIGLAIESVLEKTEIQNFLGRSRVDYDSEIIENLPESIKEKMKKIAEQFGTNHNLKYFTFVEYNNKYGRPNLGPHKDQNSFNLSVLYQMDSNISWDLYVEGVGYKLQDNAALLANVRDQDHWRPERDFKKDEYLKMLFFHFRDEDDQRLNVVTPEQLAESNAKWKHLVY
jgi:hypothetical protein